MNPVLPKVVSGLRFLKNHRKITSFLVLIIAAIFMFFLWGGDENQAQTAKVELGSVIQEVSVTGRVKPAKAVDLAFDRSGRVSYVGIKSGDRVNQGKLLIQLDASEILAQEDREEANLAVAEYRLSQLMATAEGGDGNSATVDSLSKAIKTSIDSMVDFTSVQFKYFNNSSNGANRIAQAKEEVINIIYGQGGLGRVGSWYFTPLSGGLKKQVDELGSDLEYTDFSSTISKVKDLLLVNKAALESMFSEIVSESQVSQSDIDLISSDLDSIITQITALSSQNKSIVSNGYDIDIAKSQLEHAKASVALVRAQLSKYKLLAPFSGIATNVDIKPGHIVSPNVTIFSLISNSKFQIEANISEADIAKISIGDQARVSLDAYGRDQIFNARVVDIDPGGRVIDSVAVYKVTFEFESDDDRILSGLTADIDIVANEKQDVIFAPSRDVISKEGKKYVKIRIAPESTDERFANLSVVAKLGEYKVVEVPIEIGLRGSDGRTEIISGLREGDIIVSD